jgi:WhiB family redox-sensing transcriptional regulator
MRPAYRTEQSTGPRNEAGLEPPGGGCPGEARPPDPSRSATVEGWDWQREGACRGRDTGQFFHPDGERGASRMRRELAAKSVCRACPVRAECAAHALSAREPYGVWGGFTEAERLRLLTLGWEDLSIRDGARVDVRRLEARLGTVAGLVQRRLPQQRRPPNRMPWPAPRGQPFAR